ncbi:MAG: dockerin type I domain-containing protein [Rubripirellula sp.]|nr:hypothetical protein [Rhodopirellula sp.]MCH1438899.1 dockerin type I domain-containing protein [Rubripirellula sp.]
MAKPVARSQKRRSHRRRLLVEHLSDRRVLAAITGAIFEDLNHSFQLDAGDADAPHRLVYIDTNQNTRIDAGEPYALADAEGNYRFDNVADGMHELRLFNGTETQYQTTPVSATLEGPISPVTAGTQLVSNGRAPIALTSQSVVLGDLNTGTSSEISFGVELTRMQVLPDGDLLVVGTGANGETAWQVDVEAGTSTAVNLAETDTPTPWTDIAIDSSGRGVLLEPTISHETGESVLGIRELDASNAEAIFVSEVLQSIPADAEVLASDGTKSVFAWSDSGGTQLSLWSNATASFISSSDIIGSLTSELVAFDDAAGIIAVRTASGGVGVYDTDANFAPLHTLPAASGPVAIDSSRDLLFSNPSGGSRLQLLNLRDGGMIADMAIDLSTIGQISHLAIGASNDAITVLGAAGITEIALRRADAHKVTVTNNTDVNDILFGIGIEGSNTAPAYDPEAPTFTTKEDHGFLRLAPAALAHSSDAEDDKYVVLQRGPAGNGVAIISVDGMFSYSPNPDFNGVDTIDVSLHDGRDLGVIEQVTVIVESVPDSPSGISDDLDDVPENLGPDEVIGDIEVIDADGLGGMPHTILVNDPRFVVDNGQLIFVGGNLDFETEPSVSLNISATDIETDTTIERIVSVTILDANDPIDGISPSTAEVSENSEGAFICAIQVSDPDANDTHSLTVDDGRFRISNGNLYLAEGVSLDYEQTSVIIVNMTAVDSGGETFTAPLRVTVIDVEEQPTTIALSGQDVMEWVRGAAVGAVSVDGKTPSDRFSLSVSDPRFEIADTGLKLLDSEMLNQEEQDQIFLTVSVNDTLAEFGRLDKDFIIQVQRNAAPNHNPNDPFDVDNNGKGTTGDALHILNYINIYGPGNISPDIADMFYDVNGDNLVTVLDVLLLLNELNKRALSGTVGNGEGSPEGERVVPSKPAGRLGEAEQLSKPELTPFGPIDLLTPTTPQNSNSLNTEKVSTASPSQSYADQVDQTLRLLSDERN